MTSDDRGSVSARGLDGAPLLPDQIDLRPVKYGAAFWDCEVRRLFAADSRLSQEGYDAQVVRSPSVFGEREADGLVG